MIKIQQYIRKPFSVDAVRVTEDNFIELSTWCQGEIRTNHGDRLILDNKDVDTANQHIKVRVHNPKNTRKQKAYVGDWVLYSDMGYKVYTQRAFEETFDLAEDSK